MPLDDATKQVYRRTDSATLLGLLPELRRLGKRTQKEILVTEQTLGDRRQAAGPASDADFPAAVAHPGSAADPDGGSAEPAGRDQETFAAQLFDYSVALEQRERWIRDELKRRGLIPLWPGEEHYLADDA